MPISDNATIFHEVAQDKEVWGKAWRYRAYYLAWVNGSSARLAPTRNEVMHPYPDRANPTHVMTFKDVDPVFGVRPKYYRTKIFSNSSEAPFTEPYRLNLGSPRKYPFFSYLMYEPLVESQFYFRWYLFQQLVTEQSFNILPPQADTTLGIRAERRALKASKTNK